MSTIQLVSTPSQQAHGMQCLPKASKPRFRFNDPPKIPTRRITQAGKALSQRLGAPQHDNEREHRAQEWTTAVPE